METTRRNTGVTTGVDYNSNGWSVSLSQPLFRWQNWVGFKQAELAAVNPGVVMSNALYATLNTWVDKHYRDRRRDSDRADRQWLVECRTALDELTRILTVGSGYPVQRI